MRDFRGFVCPRGSQDDAEVKSVSAALRRVLPPAVFAVLPLLVLALAVGTAAREDTLALDFHHELYPEARDILAGRDPFPPPGSDLSDGSNQIWPVAAAIAAIPFVLLPPGLADWAVTLVLVLCVPVTLLLLGVRDWRIHGVAFLWAPTLSAIQTGNLTLPLAVLAALALRYRRHEVGAGLAVGLAVALKFFLWPLIPWLVVQRRLLTALVAVAVAAAALLATMAFSSLPDFLRLVRELADTFAGLSYTPYALLVDLGTPSAVARALTLAAGFALLAACLARRSISLVIAAALVLSPIVWLHFGALLLVPLAVTRPRLDWVWLVPIVMALVPGTHNGDPWQTALFLATSALVLGMCATSERDVSPPVQGGAVTADNTG